MGIIMTHMTVCHACHLIPGSNAGPHNALNEIEPALGLERPSQAREHGINSLLHQKESRHRFMASSSFICSLNPIRLTSIPRPYIVISLLSFHHCSSQPSQYLSISSCAYIRLLNKRIEKQTLNRKLRSQSRTCYVYPGNGLCEFRIKRKETD